MKTTVTELIKRGAQLLYETVDMPWQEAIRLTEAAARKVPIVKADWGRDDNGAPVQQVTQEVSTKFLDDLIAPYVHRSQWRDDRPEVINFEAKPSNPIAELDEILSQLGQGDQAARAHGSILGGTAAPATDASTFSSAFGAAIGQSPYAVAPRTSPLAESVSKGSSGAPSGGLTLQRRLELDALVARDLQVAVSKALGAPVAKTAGRTPLALRVVRKGP